jgi:hypothetical protein
VFNLERVRKSETIGQNHENQKNTVINLRLPYLESRNLFSLHPEIRKKQGEIKADEK